VVKPEPAMPGGDKDRPKWLRFSSMGFEFAAALTGFTLVGYWIGYHCGHKTGGVLIGALLGIIGGGYNFIRSALQLSREVREREEASKGKEGS
jgi:F0F1-type ATP synthase assembly protein I